MAEKEMVRAADPFFDAVGKAVSRLQASQGPLYAALLVHLPERPADDWILLAGSRKLTKRRIDGICAIVDSLKGVIPDEYAARIRRVDVLQPDDAVYVRLSNAFHVAIGSTLTLTSCQVYGLEIEHAVVFVLQKLDTVGRANGMKSRSNKSGRAAKA